MKNIKSFESIAKPLLDNKKFQVLYQESHHGITRMEHSLRVARYVYKYAIKINLNYEEATKAAILHDFFTIEEFGTNLGLIQGIVHPDIAAENAKREFGLTKREENMIESHMFPLSMTLPKYKESWLLTAVDKIIAIYEYSSYKFNIKKLAYGLSLVLLVLFNFLTIDKK